MNRFGVFDDLTTIDIHGAQAAEAVLVAHEGHAFAGGIEAPRTLTLAPRRQSVFVGFAGTHHAVGAHHGDVQPTGGIVEPTQSLAHHVGAGLLNLQTRCATQHTRRSHQLGFIPRHVWRVPADPQRLAVPPHRIAHEFVAALVDAGDGAAEGQHVHFGLVENERHGIAIGRHDR